jgi:hypothetical protein
LSQLFPTDNHFLVRISTKETVKSTQIGPKHFHENKTKHPANRSKDSTHNIPFYLHNGAHKVSGAALCSIKFAFVRFCSGCDFDAADAN